MSGCPAFRIFRLRLVRSPSRLGARLPVVPVARSPGLPGSLSAGLAFGETCGLPRLFRSAGVAVCPIPSCPESGGYDACFRASSPGFPGPLALWLSVGTLASCPARLPTVGSMMNPLLVANFASSACAADESSPPTGSSSFRLCLRCNLNLLWHFACGLRRVRTASIDRDYLGSRAEIAVRFPTRSLLDLRL